MPARLSLLLSLVLLVVATPLLAAVDGTFTANGKTVKLTHAYAAQRPNPFDKAKTDVYLLVADRELPPEAVHDDFALMTAREGVNGFTAQITADHSVVSGQLFSPNFKQMTQFSSVGKQEVSITAMTSTRVAGKISMPKDEFFDNEYAFAATFDLPITAKPAPPAPKGKPLAAGGGEPGKAYEAYRKAMKAGDLKTLRASIVPEMAKQMDDPEFKEMFPLMQEMMPKGVKITGGAVDGDTATLTLTAAAEKSSTTTGTVLMVRQGGKWLVQKEKWNTNTKME